VDTLGHLAQKGGSNGLIRGILLEVDGNEKLLCLLIDVANIDTTLVCEENPITLSGMLAWGSGNDRRDRRSPAEKSRNTNDPRDDFARVAS
jgi:hypothetical protein